MKQPVTRKASSAIQVTLAIGVNSVIGMSQTCRLVMKTSAPTIARIVNQVTDIQLQTKSAFQSISHHAMST